MMKDDDFKLLRGFGNGWTDRLTNKQTDIGGCRVAFATEKLHFIIVTVFVLTLE